MGLPLSELFGMMSGLLVLQTLAVLALVKLIAVQPDKPEARLAYAVQAKR
jgi:hypothetical protein